MMIQPVEPLTKVMLARSKPRTCQILSDLEEAVLGHQLALAPEAGVHGGRGVGFQEIEGGEIPDGLACGCRDERVGAGGDEAALGEVEIAGVGEGAFGADLIVDGFREGRGAGLLRGSFRCGAGGEGQRAECRVQLRCHGVPPARLSMGDRSAVRGGPLRSWAAAALAGALDGQGEAIHVAGCILCETGRGRLPWNRHSCRR